MLLLRAMKPITALHFALSSSESADGVSNRIANTDSTLSRYAFAVRCDKRPKSLRLNLSSIRPPAEQCTDPQAIFEVVLQTQCLQRRKIDCE